MHWETQISRFLQSPHCYANCLQHICSSGHGIIVCKSCTTLWALIMCNMSCATWYEGTAQLLSLTLYICICIEITSYIKWHSKFMSIWQCKQPVRHEKLLIVVLKSQSCTFMHMYFSNNTKYRNILRSDSQLHQYHLKQKESKWLPKAVSV